MSYNYSTPERYTYIVEEESKSKLKNAIFVFVNLVKTQFNKDTYWPFKNLGLIIAQYKEIAVCTYSSKTDCGAFCSTLEVELLILVTSSCYCNNF